jgi:hypothetical protein
MPRSDAKTFVPRADTILGALTFCTEGRRSVVISYEHALMNLEHLEALAPEIPLVLQPVFSVHSVQFGPQGQVGSDESSQEVRRRATSHNGTSDPRQLSSASSGNRESLMGFVHSLSEVF